MRIFDQYLFNYNQIVYHALDKDKCFVMIQLNVENIEEYSELNLQGYDKIFIYSENKEKGKTY